MRNKPIKITGEMLRRGCEVVYEMGGINLDPDAFYTQHESAVRSILEAALAPSKSDIQKRSNLKALINKA